MISLFCHVTWCCDSICDMCDKPVTFIIIMHDIIFFLLLSLKVRKEKKRDNRKQERLR